ncbi:MAG: class I SAM-dependent methyltransferase [Planctomycetota bacterium]|jgi:SAM-dependent methyltransferase
MAKCKPAISVHLLFGGEDSGPRLGYKDHPLWRVFRHVVTYLQPMRSPAILEIGCGAGQLAHYLHDLGLRRYVGVDFSPAAIELARAASPQAFEVADIRDPGTFDRP